MESSIKNDIDTLSHTIKEFVKEEAFNDRLLQDRVDLSLNANNVCMSGLSNKQTLSYIKIMKFIYSSLLDAVEKREKNVSTN